MDIATYQKLAQQAAVDPATFWGQQAREKITWLSPWTQVLQGGFDTHDIRWFVDGTLNACHNCIDRHLATRREQIALIFEGNEPGHTQRFTYAQLHQHVCRFANILKKLNVQKGDHVCLYLPMIPEAIFAMLACARLGAVHSVVFAGFSAEALKTRILDADCRVLITADASIRGNKTILLKKQADEALKNCPDIEHVLVIKNTRQEINWHAPRDQDYHTLLTTVSDDCPIEPMLATDPLFILYTSGSTGKPKGVLHSTGGYLVYATTTFQTVFQVANKDVYWCTADIGWITGHSYLVYGPLASGVTTLLFDGVPNYPTFSRYWEIIDTHQVTQFYTSPTALRALRREGDAWVSSTSRASLKLLGSVGEPLNPDVWSWFHDVIGNGQCDIVNTWWQTETGGILLTPLPGITPNAPGSIGEPLPGIKPMIVDESGQPTPPGKSGQLVIQTPWPGLMQSIYGDHQRFIDSYLKPIPGFYLAGDTAHCDEQGLYWVTGRTDDVLKVSGHRIGTEEVESALISSGYVAEAGVVGIPDEIRGEKIYAFVTLSANIIASDAKKQQLIEHVRHSLGPFAAPSVIHWASALPKTRSGKIMRRLLRQIANHEWDKLGDTSTLSNPESIDALIKESV